MNKVYKIRTASTPCSALLRRTSLGSTDDAIIVRSQDRIKRCQNSFWRDEDLFLVSLIPYGPQAFSLRAF